MKENSKSSIDDAEHIFRFELDNSTAQKSDIDPLVEMVRSFIADFLDIGCFTDKGKRVQVDGFFFTSDPERQHPVFGDRFFKKINTDTSFDE